MKYIGGMADILTSQLVSDCYLRYQLLYRMLGILMAATSLVPLDLLELRAFQEWDISLWLSPKYHKQKGLLVSARGVQDLVSWRCKDFLRKRVHLEVMPHQRDSYHRCLWAGEQCGAAGVQWASTPWYCIC